MARRTIRGTSGPDQLVATSADNPNQRVIYDSITGKIFFDSDGSGIAEGELVVTIPVNLQIVPANVEMF